MQFINKLILTINNHRSLDPLLLATFNPNAASHLRNMRERLSDDITAFVNENGPTALEDFDPHKFDKEAPTKAENHGIFDGASIAWLGNDRSLFNFSTTSSSNVSTASSDANDSS